MFNECYFQNLEGKKIKQLVIFSVMREIAMQNNIYLKLFCILETFYNFLMPNCKTNYGSREN